MDEYVLYRIYIDIGYRSDKIWKLWKRNFHCSSASQASGPCSTCKNPKVSRNQPMPQRCQLDTRSVRQLKSMGNSFLPKSPCSSASPGLQHAHCRTINAFGSSPKQSRHRLQPWHRHGRKSKKSEDPMRSPTGKARPPFSSEPPSLDPERRKGSWGW